MRYLAPVLVLLVPAIPDLAQAQSESPAARSMVPTAAQLAALASLQRNSTVRVHSATEGWLSGSVSRNGAGSLILSSGDSERAVPLAEIDSALVRHGNPAIGATLGALLGMIIGASNATGCTTKFLEYDCHLGPAMGGLVFGGILGAGVGAAVPIWERRLPMESPDSQVPPDAPNPLTGR